MAYAIATTLNQEFTQTVSAVREALIREGFGILTEIDISATLKAKVDVDIAPQVILGACNPQLAHRALLAEASIGLLLPCNVVVRSIGADHTLIEAIDPQVMVDVTGNADLSTVAAEASARLKAALDGLVLASTTE